MNDSTKYQVFSVQQVDSFKRLEDLDILLPVPIEFVIDVLCSDPKVSRLFIRVGLLSFSSLLGPKGKRPTRATRVFSLW
jgi:hypothetical protein